MNNETIEFEGKLYEIGKYYEFRDEDYPQDEWHLDRLLGLLDDEEHYNFYTENSYYVQIRTIEPSILGTVKDKPIELIDGEAYVFDYRGKSDKGIFDAESERFFCVKSWVVPHACKNIRRLVER